MAADASIYNLIRPAPALPDPLEQYGKQIKISSLMDESSLNQLKRRELEKGIARDDELTAAVRGSGGDPAKMRQAFITAGDHKGLAAWEKANLDATKIKGDIRKTDIEILGSATKQLRDMLATVNDDAGMAQLKDATFRLFGPDVAAKMNTPDRFDPVWKDRQLMTADKLLERMTPQMVEEFDGQVKRWVDKNPYTNPAIKSQATAMKPTIAEQESQRHNPIMEGIARQNANTSAGQLTETRANNQRPVYDMERGGFASRPQPGQPSTFTPVTNAPPGQKQIIATREDTDNLRKEFEAKPTVKAYRDVLPIVGAAKSAPDTRSGDIQMAYAVGKILDPASVVREGELKLVGDAATVMGKIEGQLRTLTQGKGRLSPETRAELNAMLENAVGQRKASFDAEKTSYGGIVARRGYKPEDVFIDTPAPVPAAAKPPAPERVSSLPDPATKKGWTATDPASGIKYESDGKSWKRVGG